MKKTRIELQGVVKSYYSESTVTQALKKIDLSFETGEFVAITGESGSGKSTLLHIIGGLDTFDDGEMFIDGEPTFPYDENDWEEYRRSRIGYVFQDYNLIGHYSAKNNIVSALLIMGREKSEAERVAAEYLKKVGLDGYEDHKASELSSGQKQRLSIARALAKDTPVIIADEPTGNLDTETGNQIIKLLKELSKDRLVIMVTHNIDQAEAYITRKIRLYDGTVIFDQHQNSREEVPEKEEKKQAGKGLGKRALASFFSTENIKTQPGRNFLFISFLFLMAVVSFALIGELWMHRDDATTKSYSPAAFAREDMTRLVAIKKNGAEFTAEDVAKVLKIANVATVDICDYSNDINYYMIERTDYEYLHSARTWFSPGKTTLSFINTTRFMMSAECLKESDLAEGHLPESKDEVVLYSDDPAMLGRTYLTYFSNKNLWGSGEHNSTKVKVVGLLKEETNQVYFSKELCQSLGMHMDSDLFRIYYAYNNKTMDYTMKPEMTLVINNSLTGNNVILSESLETQPGLGDVLFYTFERDSDGNVTGNPVEEYVKVTGYSDLFTSTFMEVSPEFFYAHYTAKTKQLSVYLTSYAKTDNVISKLSHMGYDAVSTYRVSVADYLPDKVEERVTIIGICAAGLLVVALVEVLLLRALQKLNLKNFRLLKFIGARLSVMKLISVFEMAFYCVIAIILATAFAFVLYAAGVPVVKEIIDYMTPVSYLLFVLYNVCLAGITVLSFNSLLKGRLEA